MTWLVEECDGTVVGEGVVLICDMWLVEECGGTVLGEGVVLLCDVARRGMRSKQIENKLRNEKRSLRLPLS